MALAKTGHVSEGKQLLQQIEKTMAPYLEHCEGDLWWDVVFGKIALDEAHMMFAQLNPGSQAASKYRFGALVHDLLVGPFLAKSLVQPGASSPG